MPSFDPKELLSHSAWLRGLARSLVHEGAEDLVQETWVAALGAPPRAERGLRPWLRTVLTNAARMRWRSDANRTAREHAAEKDEVPTPDELLERHELSRLLARLVGELREPFRSTILLRFAEGLTPTEIARRLGIPAGTVRWRLKEGLALLRAELDALHRGDRRAWMLAVAPLALPRGASSTSLVPWLAAIVAAAAATVLVVLIAARSSDPSHTVAAGPEAGRPPTAGSRHRGIGIDRDALTWLAQEGAPDRRLTGRVTMAGVPVRGAEVRLAMDPLPPRELQTDAAGRFDLGELRAREYDIGASLPGTLAAIRHLDLRDPTAAHEIELVLQDCTAGIHGRITDAAGTPIEGAQVLREGMIGARSDRSGAYTLCVLPTAALAAEIRIVVRADGFGALSMLVAPPGLVRRDFVLAPEAAITGRVVSARGEPIADARIGLDLTGPISPPAPERGVPLATVSDSDGGFRIAGLSAGEYTVVATSARGTSAPVHAVVEAAETRTVELQASPTGSVHGRIVENGRPIGGVAISAGSDRAVSQPDGRFVLARVAAGEALLEATPYKLIDGRVHVVAGERTAVDLAVVPMAAFHGVVRRHGVPVPFARVSISGPSKIGVTAGADGHYRAPGLETGLYRFYSDDRRRGAMFATDRVELGEREAREYDIDLAWGGTIAGRVVDPRGNAVPDVTIAIDGDVSSVCASDASGAFACSGLSGGSYTASVRPGRTGAHPFRLIGAPRTVSLRDGDARLDDVRLVVEPTVSSITGVVTDRAGAPVPDVTVRAFAVDLVRRSPFDQELAALTDDAGRFRIGELSPGDYHVEVRRGELATRATLTAGATSASLVLDRSACDGARGHDVPAGLTRPAGPVRWNEQLELIGWSVPATASAGEAVELVLAFRSNAPVDRDWRVFAHFDSESIRVNVDHEPAIGWCPTSEWRPGEIVVDRTPVRFARPGRYALRVGFFTGSAPSWENLPLTTRPPAMVVGRQTDLYLGDVVVK